MQENKPLDADSTDETLEELVYAFDGVKTTISKDRAKEILEEL